MRLRIGIDRQDLLYAIRSARRAPLLSIVAVLALSLGIGLNAGVFTLLNALFFTPPTEKDPASFVQVYPRYEAWFTGAGQYSSFTTEDYDAIRTQAATLQEVAAWAPGAAILEQANSGAGIPAMLVTCNYFHVLGIDRPLQGRLLTPQECQPGSAAKVVVMSELMWRSRFGADPHIVGRIIHLNGLPFSVVGVVPSGSVNLQANGVFEPYTIAAVLDHGAANRLTNPDAPWLQAGGRLRPG